MLPVAVPVLASVILAIAGQFPAVQNGQVDTRPASDLAADIARLGAGSDPVWIAWSVPMVPGDRNLCSTWSTQALSGRGTYLEGWTSDAPPTPMPPPAGPVALEAGTRLVVLVRVVSGQVERLRTVADDCPLDAGGRRLTRLDAVTADASLRYLETFVTAAGRAPSDSLKRGLHNSALSAIALHDSAVAEAILERLVEANMDSDTGRQAASWLGRARGRAGFDALVRMLPSARTAGAQRNVVAAIGQASQPDTFDTLARLARTHADERVRIEAVRAISTSTDPRAQGFLLEVIK